MSLNEKKSLFSHIASNLFYFAFLLFISVIFLKKKKKHCLLCFSLFGFLFISCNSALIVILYILYNMYNFVFHFYSIFAAKIINIMFLKYDFSSFDLIGYSMFRSYHLRCRDHVLKPKPRLRFHPYVCDGSLQLKLNLI